MRRILQLDHFVKRKIERTLPICTNLHILTACGKPDFHNANGAIVDMKGGQVQEKRVLVIGLGEIGYNNAEYMTSRGLAVDGYDISEKAVSRALEAGIIRNRASSFSDYDYYVICISTHNPNDMFVPYQEGILEIAARIAEVGKQGALIGIDSTISKGTTKAVLDIVRHRLHVVHVPHRYYKYEKDVHGVNQTRVMGGLEKCCIDKGREFYGGALGITLHPVSSAEVAELTKIVENSYRYVEIAFAEELKMFCDKSGIDFSELRNAINTKWNVKVLEAKEGIGGHCLPKDSQMFLNLSADMIQTSIIDAAKKVDLEYRHHITQKVPQPLIPGR
jgi:UDP-N-acetyl-D-mannosaminuronic acid dehydrogenase